MRKLLEWIQIARLMVSFFVFGRLVFANLCLSRISFQCCKPFSLSRSSTKSRKIDQTTDCKNRQQKEKKCGAKEEKEN
jgi:hypothetical protein